MKNSDFKDIPFIIKSNVAISTILKPGIYVYKDEGKNENSRFLEIEKHKDNIAGGRVFESFVRDQDALA